MVRSVAAEDIPLIERVMPRRMPGTHRERLEQQERGDALYLIAWLEGAPVGHLLLKWGGLATAASALSNCPSLSDIAVHSAHQSRGIGTQLMEHAEQLAAQRGHAHVSLAVALDNTRARVLYERRGYLDSNLGTHDSRWPYLDDCGQEHWHEETCVRLVKPLVECPG